MDRLAAYQVLGLRGGAPADEIRRAYLDLVKVWHPDRFEGDARLQAKASVQLQSINLAYAVLCELNSSEQPGATRPPRRPAPAPTPPSSPPPPRSAAPIFTETIEQQEAKRKNARVTLGILVYIGIGLVAIFVAFVHDQSARPSSPIAVQEPEASSTQATTSVAPDPRSANDILAEIDKILRDNSTPNAAAPVKPSSPPSGPVDRPYGTLPNGTELVRAATRGHGELNIDNGTTRDAVVALLAGDQPQRAIYVASHQKAVLKSVALGSYVVRYCSGLDWDDEERTFRAERFDAEFESRLNFTEQHDDERGTTRVSTFELTLHPGPDPIRWTG